MKYFKMASSIIRLSFLSNVNRKVSGSRCYCVGSKPASPKQPSGTGSKVPPSITSVDVPGLSAAVYQVPSGGVGPGASKDGEYKNPEYYSYHNTSYFEAEIEMLKYRIPQPSSLSK
ncbi:uncharacterized protein LOC124798278 [Schistocerca piceifrons]|uniref:uncharacterized protein LOC124798278 n=1 Tax=Schistocerca piceifrons TaxID=274613 RepID=UPI001F5F0BA2|nr:uncharacterized protein LOC124798278 [Schistocerca piceifrons]